MSNVQTLINTINSNNFVVLDTETTGLERPAEIVQIAIIDCNGTALLDCYVNNRYPVPKAAQDIHHITDEVLKKYGLPWSSVRPLVLKAIESKDVIVYNAKYDRMMLHLTDEANGYEHTEYKTSSNWICAMTGFAEWNGELHPYFGSYVWKSLDYATSKLRIINESAHSALGDCNATLAVCRKLAELKAK